MICIFLFLENCSSNSGQSKLLLLMPPTRCVGLPTPTPFLPSSLKKNKMKALRNSKAAICETSIVLAGALTKLCKSSHSAAICLKLSKSPLMTVPEDWGRMCTDLCIRREFYLLMLGGVVPQMLTPGCNRLYTHPVSSSSSACEL